MQPLDPEKEAAVHATPLNHVGLWVDDLPAAVAWMTAHGVLCARRDPQGRRGTTSASSTRRATTSSRSAARAC